LSNLERAWTGNGKEESLTPPVMRPNLPANEDGEELMLDIADSTSWE
jgi:hypothetical protein